MQKYHPFHRDSVKINDLLLTFASKFLLQIARFQLSCGVTDGEKSITAAKVRKQVGRPVVHLQLPGAKVRRVALPNYRLAQLLLNFSRSGKLAENRERAIPILPSPRAAF